MARSISKLPVLTTSWSDTFLRALKTVLPLTSLSIFLILGLSGCALTSSNPNNIYELHQKAQSAYVAEQDDQAEVLLIGLARAAPNDPQTWFHLGNLYARTNRPERAIAAYEKALMLNSTDPRVWHNVGVVRTRQAWAAFIQAHVLTAPKDPLYARLEALIEAMKDIPLDGFKDKDGAKDTVVPAETFTPSSAK